jgi:hypothetical protein
MSQKENKPRMVGPWRRFHVVIWLLGLAILAWGDWWWPGILFLVAISILYEAILSQFAPQAFEEAEPQTSQTQPSQPPRTQSSQMTAAPAPMEHRLELLPSVCPKCSAPIRGSEVKWTGPQSADCPYCGANLPMEKE